MEGEKPGVRGVVTEEEEMDAPSSKREDPVVEEWKEGAKGDWMGVAKSGVVGEREGETPRKVEGDVVLRE